MQPPPPNPLAAARRASVVMFILGGLMLACGGTCAGFSFFPTDQLRADPNTRFGELDDMAMREVGIGFMQIVLIVGLVMLAPGLLYVILGFFVRRGGLPSVVVALVLTSILLLLDLLGIVSAVVQIGRDPSRAGGVCFYLVPAALLGTLMYFLIGAARASGHVRAMRDQHASTYWQYQQNQQAYGQAGYGYAPQSPPPPPPPPQSPQSPQSPPPDQSS
jgi:hypothetical protein